MTESEEFTIGDQIAAFPILLFLLMMFRPDVVVVAGSIAFLIAYTVAFPEEAISNLNSITQTVQEELLSIQKFVSSIEFAELFQATVFVIVFSGVAIAVAYLYITYVIRPGFEDSETDWIDEFFGGDDCE